LKFAPASWKGKPLVAVAVVLAFVLSVAQLYLTGKHLDWTSSSTFASVVAGQQLFYALFKDDLKL